jgi:phosphoribosylformimino-5-aminoimidazole carboxamide ribotide isomerase
MLILPAIDLRGGQAVRLKQGDYNRETVYGDPVEMAQRWVSAGGEYLHLVDLDGARDGKLVNQEAIASIVKAVGVPCELGGGIRDATTIKTLLDLGLQRLVVGTEHPGVLALGIDARDGKVATDGWLETSETSAVDLAKQFEDLPVAAIIYTDISRDGMLQGANVSAMADMQQATRCPVIASGGVTTVEDVVQLAKIPMDGCIIGRALYEDTLSLQEALAAAANAAVPPASS